MQPGQCLQHISNGSCIVPRTVHQQPAPAGRRSLHAGWWLHGAAVEVDPLPVLQPVLEGAHHALAGRRARACVCVCMQGRGRMKCTRQTSGRAGEPDMLQSSKRGGCSLAGARTVSTARRRNAGAGAKPGQPVHSHNGAAGILDQAGAKRLCSPLSVPGQLATSKEAFGAALLSPTPAPAAAARDSPTTPGKSAWAWPLFSPGCPPAPPTPSAATSPPTAAGCARGGAARQRAAHSGRPPPLTAPRAAAAAAAGCRRKSWLGAWRQPPAQP